MPLFVEEVQVVLEAQHRRIPECLWRNYTRHNPALLLFRSKPAHHTIMARWIQPLLCFRISHDRVWLLETLLRPLSSNLVEVARIYEWNSIRLRHISGVFANAEIYHRASRDAQTDVNE